MTGKIWPGLTFVETVFSDWPSFFNNPATNYLLHVTCNLHMFYFGCFYFCVGFPLLIYVTICAVIAFYYR